MDVISRSTMASWHLRFSVISSLRYLKDSPQRLDEALASAQQGGYIYAVKLVRGADPPKPPCFRPKVGVSKQNRYPKAPKPHAKALKPPRFNTFELRLKGSMWPES